LVFDLRGFSENLNNGEKVLALWSDRAQFKDLHIFERLFFRWASSLWRAIRHLCYHQEKLQHGLFTLFIIFLIFFFKINHWWKLRPNLFWVSLRWSHRSSSREKERYIIHFLSFFYSSFLPLRKIFHYTYYTTFLFLDSCLESTISLNNTQHWCLLCIFIRSAMDRRRTQNIPCRIGEAGKGWLERNLQKLCDNKNSNTSCKPCSEVLSQIGNYR